MKHPKAITYTTQVLYEQIHSGIIHEPEYQRDVVWPEARQMDLIDSVIRNFYIPPVVFAVKVGSRTKTCIDGKQRLTSIHKFMDGLIPYEDPLTGGNLWYKDVQLIGKGSRTRRLLPDERRKAFAKEQIVCMEYWDITDADEREIYQKIQFSMALTPSEKLQVINSPRASFIRKLQTKYLKEDRLSGDTLDWDRSRSSDFRWVSQAIFCMEYFSSKLKDPTIVQLEKWLNLQAPFSSEFEAKISDAYRIFAKLVQDRKLKKVFKKPATVSPVEFTAIGLLVFVHKDTFTMSQMSDAIAKMRDDVRTNHVDIKMNSQVMKTLIDFIKSLQMPKNPGNTGEPAGATGSTAGLKRKRTEQHESEDEKSAGQNSKAKKRSATVSNVKPSGSPQYAGYSAKELHVQDNVQGRNTATTTTGAFGQPIGLPSKAAEPLSVKAKPVTSPVVSSQTPKPAPPDRMISENNMACKLEPNSLVLIGEPVSEGQIGNLS